MSADRRPAPPPRRMGRDYYLSPLASVLRMVCPVERAQASWTMIEYCATGRPGANDSSDRRRWRGRGGQGNVRELAAHAEVSDAVMRGLVHAGAGGC